MFSPANVIFASVGILFLTAKRVNASRDTLVNIFSCVEGLFKQLESSTDVPPTPAMTNATVRVMIEALNILAATTEEIKQSRRRECKICNMLPLTYAGSEKYLQKLFGRKNDQNKLAKLDQVTRELAQMALDQVAGEGQ
ncbi:hypothetical protein V8E53_006623 [Lactarius tabidus]